MGGRHSQIGVEMHVDMIIGMCTDMCVGGYKNMCIELFVGRRMCVRTFAIIVAHAYACTEPVQE